MGIRLSYSVLTLGDFGAALVFLAAAFPPLAGVDFLLEAEPVFFSVCWVFFFAID